MTTHNSNQLPTTTGLSLGSINQRWNASLQNVSIAGSFSAPGIGLAVMAFSATPVFDGSAAGAFEITLTGNAASSTFINLTSGYTYTFIIKQDTTGGRTFVWPAVFVGAMIIDRTAQATNVQQFVYDGANLYAVSAGVSM